MTGLRKMALRDLWSDEIDCEGRYTVDAKASVITLNAKRNGVAFTQKIRFNLKDNYLQLEYLEDESNFEITLKKVNLKQ